MLYLLDTANVEDIRHCIEYYPIAGVTTNPTLIAREKDDFWKLVREIREIIGPDRMLHVQTTQTEAEKIVEEAQLLKKELGGDFYIKIPIGEEGLRATMMLKKLGIKVTMTAIFTEAQALIAAKAGASFVAPYVNRLDNILGDGVEVVAETVKILKNYGLDCRVLAASFKNAEQVHKCSFFGCQSATVTSSIMKSLISHPMTDAAIRGFEKDWRKLYGTNNILDMIK